MGQAERNATDGEGLLERCLHQAEKERDGG